MTTLITAYAGTTIIGQCDARCYAQTGHGCRCICNDLNHGVGLKKADENSYLYRDQLARTIKQRFPETTEVVFQRPAKHHHFHAPQPNPHTLPRDAA